MTVQLTKEETLLLCFIPRGIEKPISIKELTTLCNMDKRKIHKVVNRLTSLGAPICSIRLMNNSSGLFIPLTEEQRVRGLTALKSQASDMCKRVSNVEKADLSNWGQDFIMFNEKVAEFDNKRRAD